MGLRELRPRAARRVMLDTSLVCSEPPSRYLRCFHLRAALISAGMWFCGSRPIGSPRWVPLSLLCKSFPPWPFPSRNSPRAGRLWGVPPLPKRPQEPAAVQALESPLALFPD